MLGFRLNKLGAAMRSGLDLRSLYGGGASGFLPKLDNADYDKQTFNAQVTNAASAGDPIGLWLPSQSPTDVTNLLLWSDAFDNAAWNKFACTVTANVAANPDSVPVADLLTATGADGVCSQDVTVSASTNYTFSVWLRAGSATTLTIFLFTTGFATISSTVCNVTTSWQQFTVTANSGVNTTIRVAIGGGSTFSSPEAVFASRAQLNLGSTVLDYQPNAGSLGGSNRRTGGANLLLWSEEQDNTAGGWSLTDSTVTRGSIAGPGGSTNGNLVTEGVAGTAAVQQAFSVLANSTVTQSFFVKKGSLTWVRFFIFEVAASTNRVSGWFNVNTGVVGSATNGGTGSGATVAITDAGNGWYRCVLTGAVNNSATALACSISSASADGSTARVNSSTYYVTQTQVNLGSTADTYSRNIDQLGGLLLSAPLFQSTSANRGTLARRPASGIRNRLLNNVSTGVVAGSPGTAHTSWSGTSTGGVVTRTIGTPYAVGNAIYVPYRFQFSGVGNATISFVNSSNNAITAANAQVWANAVSVKLSAGAYTNITSSLYLNEYDGAGTYLTGSGSGFTATATAATFSHSRTLSASPTYVGGGIFISASGAADITLDVAAAQIERTSVTATQYVTSAADITESGQPDVWHTYWDGTSDFGTFGVQSFGSASLFAAAGQAWTVWGVARTTNNPGSAQTLLAKAGGTAASMTLRAFISNVGDFRVTCRGTETATSVTVNDGVFHTWALRWNGSAMQLRLDNQTYAVSVGTAAEEAQNITVSARTESAPANFFNGHNDVAMIDRALTDGEIATLMGNLNTTYRSGL